MREIALHILDIAENSTRAGAGLVEIEVIESEQDDKLSVSVKDDGKGFDEDAKLDDPYFTSKDSKKFGLGIPFFRQAAEACEGSFKVESTAGQGATLTATFRLGHIDLMPMGDLGATLAALVGGSPETDFVLRYVADGHEYVLDTRQLREEIDGLPLNLPQVLQYIKDNVNEGARRSNGR